MSIGQLQVELDLDSGQFTGKLIQAGQAVQTFGKKVDSGSTTLTTMRKEIVSTTDAMEQMKVAMVGFAGFTALKSIVGGLIEAQVQMQQIHFTLLSATGSARGANQEFEFISRTARELGLNLQPAAQAFGQLAAAATASGISMDQAEKLFTSFGRASTVLHLSSEQSQHALLALTEMMSRGTIQARQLNQQLGFAIPGSAARFKNAVMEAIKGTNLAGQSFEKLERKGLLVTARFMPQLIEALDQSGRGWEEAAQGLNSGINQLKTSWFNLKADLSTGLFSDVANTSVRFMAQNLSQLAGVATGLGVVLAARVLSVGVGKVGGITQLIEYNATLRAQQKAEIDASLAKIESAKAQMAETQARLADLEVQKASIVEIRAETMANLELANSRLTAAKRSVQIAAMPATGFSPTPKGFAAAGVVAAEKERNAVFREAALLGTAASSNELKLIAARKAAAEAAVVLATAEAGEVTILGALGGSLAKFGSGLLSLAGGPIGLVVLAIGAMAYAVYDARKKAEDAEIQFVSQAKTLADMRGEIHDTIAAYKGIGGATLNVAGLARAWADANRQMMGAQKSADELRVSIAKEKAARDENVDPAGADARIATATAQLARLDAQVQKDQASFRELSSTVQDATSPEGFQKLMIAARDLDDVKLNKLLEQFSLLESAGHRAAEAMRAINSGIDDKLWLLQLDTVKKKQGEYAAWRMDTIKKMADKAGGIQFISKADLKEFTDGADAVEKKMTELQNIKDDKKAAGIAQKKSDAFDAFFLGLKEKVAGLKAALVDGDVVLMKFLETVKLGDKSPYGIVSPEKLKAIKDYAAQIKDLKEKTKEKNIADKATQDIATIQERQAGELANAYEILAKAKDDALGSKQKKTTTDAFEKSTAQIRVNIQGAGAAAKKLGEELDDAKVKQGIIDAAGFVQDMQTLLDAGKLDLISDPQLRAAAELEQKIAAIQGRADKMRAQHPDGVGMDAVDAAAKAAQDSLRRQAAINDDTFGSAIERYKRGAMTVAQAWDSAMQLSTDALLEFLNTGKFNFKGFLVDILKMVEKMMIQKAMIKFAEMFLNFGGGDSAASHQGDVPTFHAMGGVFGPSGSIPLFKYANGGIANRPQMAVFGEGRLPEAYVPLPDGRSIPVTMRGGQGGSFSSSSVEINVSVDNTGAATDGNKKSDGKEEAKQFGNLLSVKVKEVMASEMRQGGMLWRMKHG